MEKLDILDLMIMLDMIEKKVSNLHYCTEKNQCIDIIVMIRRKIIECSERYAKACEKTVSQDLKKK